MKIVICDRAACEWTRNELAERLRVACPICFSPSHGEVDARTLDEWVLDDQLAVRLQVQLHKVLWGDVPGR